MYKACISLSCFWQPTVLHFIFLDLHSVFINNLDMLGRRESALYFMTKKKMPKKAHWGELPGSNFEEDEVNIMDRSVR